MTAWLEELRQLAEAREPAVLVTVAGVRGSAPREAGARMVVTRGDTAGTIGGGTLEYQCTKIAARLLEAAPGRGTVLRRFPLGAGCGQCCGGVVDVLFEALPATGPGWLAEALEAWDARRAFVIATALQADGLSATLLVTTESRLRFGDAEPGLLQRVHDEACRLLEDGAQQAIVLPPRVTGEAIVLEPVRAGAFEIAIFGAGHVGSALAAALAGLDCRLRWIDGRRNVFPERVPCNISCIESAEPAREVMAMPPGACYVVMTHSHAVDYEICEAILGRDDFAYCGLIGSRTKRRRFENLMRKSGMSAEKLKRLTCPIGIAGIRGKKPQEIAIAVAAELLRHRDQSARIAPVAHGDNVHKLRR